MTIFVTAFTCQAALTAQTGSLNRTISSVALPVDQHTHTHLLLHLHVTYTFTLPVLVRRSRVARQRKPLLNSVTRRNTLNLALHVVPLHKLRTSQRRDSATLQQEEASRLEKNLYLWATSAEGR